MNGELREHCAAVLLWSGSYEGYGQDYILNDNPLNYDILMVISLIDDIYRTVSLNIIDGFVYSGATIHRYKFVDFICGQPRGNVIKINSILWTNQNSNTGVKVTAIYGIR